MTSHENKEYIGIRPVHNHSGIFVKVYHSSVVLLQYDGEPFVKRILWKKLTARVHSILLETNLDYEFNYVRSVRVCVYPWIRDLDAKLSYRILEYSWRVQPCRRLRSILIELVSIVRNCSFQFSLPNLSFRHVDDDRWPIVFEKLWQPSTTSGVTAEYPASEFAEFLLHRRYSGR